MARFAYQDNIQCNCGKVTPNPILKRENAVSIMAKLNSGELVQVAAPDLSPEEREVLISGLCPDCQKAIFGGEG